MTWNNVSLYKEEIISTRRMLHQIPESGFEEFKTQAALRDFLSKLEHVEIVEVAKTGLLAIFNGGFETSVALRADMDALSMQEMTSHDFKSRHEGFMHACGHDGHMTVMLYLCKWLSEHFEALKQNVVVIFQPAEEGPGGAKDIVEAGIFDTYGIKEIYGYHLYPEVAQGRFATRTGPLMAMTGEFDICINGVSGHGAIPHKAIDSAVIAAELVLQLQNIVSRRISPIDPAVVTVGRVAIGERRNIIAEKAVLEGTFRAFSQDVFQKIKSCMLQYAKGVETSYGIQVDVEIREMYPPVLNDAELVASFKAANEGLVDDIEPQMIAEDFSYYQQVVPGIFVFAGTKNEALGFVHGLHSSKFDFDEDALLLAIEAMLNMLKERSVLA